MANQGGKKGRKVGRNAAYCKRYENSGQYGRNRTAKLRRHLKQYPNDGQAAAALATPRAGKWGNV